MAMFRRKRAVYWAILILSITTPFLQACGGSRTFPIDPRQSVLDGNGLGISLDFRGHAHTCRRTSGLRSKVDISSDLGVDQGEGTNVSFQAAIRTPI